MAHYSGEPGSTEPARITISTLSEFLKGGKKQVRRYKMALSKEESVKLALSRIGEERYHIIFNNCEHFARWCRTGQVNSEQVTRAIRIVSRLLSS